MKRNLRDLLPKIREALDLPSFPPPTEQPRRQHSAWAPPPPQSVTLHVTDTEELVLHRHTTKRSSHLGCFHFLVEGKNTIVHKAESSALPGKRMGSAGSFQRAGAQGHYT